MGTLDSHCPFVLPSIMTQDNLAPGEALMLIQKDDSDPCNYARS